MINSTWIINGENVEVQMYPNEKLSTVEKYLVKNPFTFPVMIDAGGVIGRQYGVTAFPTMFIVDREGVVRYHFQGLRSEEVLESALKAAGL